MKKIYFVRHGQTVWNVENKICGVVDSPLTEEGYSQAIATGEAIQEAGIQADIILTSPLSRALETANRIGGRLKLPVVVEPRLIEQNFGKWEGTPRDGADFKVAKAQFCDRYEGGESMMQMAQRIYNLLDELKEDDKIYILVAHNGIARVVHSYFNSMTNEEYASHGVKNCAIVEYML